MTTNAEMTADQTAKAEDREATIDAERAAKREAMLNSLDDFGRMALDRLNGQVAARNADVSRLDTVGGDRVSRLDALREDPPAEAAPLAAKVASLQDALNEALEARDKALNAIIDAEIANSDVDPEALKEAIKVADGNIRSGLNYLTGLYGDDVKVLVTDQKPLKGARRSGGSTGTSGKRRLRGFTVSVNDVVATSPDKDGVQKSSFSAAAKVIGLSNVDPLSAAYRERNGEDPDKFPAEDTFEFSHEGATFTVKAVRA